MTTDTRLRHSTGGSWAFIAAGGAIWGTGVARTLAQDLHIALCFGVPGTALIALLGAVAAIAVGLLLSRRGDDVPSVAAAFLPLLLPLMDVLSEAYQPWRGPVLLAGSVTAVLLFAARLDRRSWLVLAVALPLIVYLPDLSPYVGRADTFEFQVIGPQLGIAHPSGYPLYTLICKLFSWLPFGTVAWRINLSSAVFAALSAGCLYLALVADLDDGAAERARPVAFLAATVLAFSPTLWSRSIEAEVYALNGCLVALGLLLAVRWHAGRLRPKWAWPALGLLIGVSISSHITLGALAALAVTGLLVKRLRPRAGTRARTWGLALLLGVLGLSLYAYIPLRWPAVTGGERMSLQAFFRFATNADSGGALRPLAFYQDAARWGGVGRLFVAQVGWVGLFLAVTGLVTLVQRRAALAMGMVLAFGAWVWFSLSFYVADPDYSAFLIPAHVVLVYWLGCGALTLDRVVPARYPFLRPAYLTLLAALALSRVWQTGPTLDTKSQGHADEAWARYVLAQPLAEDAAILADSEKFPPLYYLQHVEGLRPDLDLVTLFSEAQYRADLEARLNRGQAVYLARYLPGMDAFGVSSEGPLVAAGTERLTAVPAESGTDFGGQLALVSSESASDPFGRPLHHLTLTWEPLASGLDDLEAQLRLVNPADGATVWTMSGTRPVSGYSTTQAWTLGQQVDDYYALTWPAWLPRGIYQLELGLFPRFGEQGLPVAGDGGMWHPLDQVAVRAQPVPPTTRRLAVLFGPQVWLVGQSIAQEVTVGGTLTLDLAWLCRASSASSSMPADVGFPGSGSVPQVRWVPLEGGEPLTQPLYALGESQLSELCQSPITAPTLRRYSVDVPPELGNYRLDVFRPPGETAQAGRSVRCRWSGATAAACPLSEVRVVSSDTGLANFDGRLLLLEAAVDAGDIPAGGQLAVDVRWRAQQTLDHDYTVFVQVVGPDGKLYGQVDSWPVQGARPTSGWRAGEEIDDPYRFYVAPGAPAGDHQVIVGWYLLADMSRLPVVDAARREVGDFYEVGTFSLP